jgi:hypothetical protein
MDNVQAMNLKDIHEIPSLESIPGNPREFPDSFSLKEIQEMYEEPSRGSASTPFIYIVAAKAIINFSPLYLRFTQES